MSVAIARPQIAQLTFQVYERSLHPELFESYAETRTACGRCQVVLRLCQSGHLLQVAAGNDVLTEVIACNGQELPKHKRLFERSLRGCRHEDVRLDWRLHYQSSYQMETLDGTIFRQYHEELRRDAQDAALAVCAEDQSRFGVGAVSLLRVDAASDSLLVHAFHTFPDEQAIVRTQSLFEF